MKRLKLATTFASLTALLLLAGPAAAQADFGIVPPGDPSGEGFASAASQTTAGSHPDLTTSFTFNHHEAGDPFPGVAPDDDGKNVVVDLPPGFAGDPQAYPLCANAFLSVNGFCPADSQVGVIRYHLAIPEPNQYISPIYNMVPRAGHVAELSFFHSGTPAIPIHIQISVRSGSDYGIVATSPNIPANLKTLSAAVTIWGVPADESHDTERGNLFFGGGCLIPYGPPRSLPGCHLASGAPRKPFFSAPTQCTAPTQTAIAANSWQHPATYTTPLLSEPPQTFSACDNLAFEPSIEAKPTTNLADSPSGLDFTLHLPQNEDPDGTSEAQLKDTVVTLPEGLTVNPSSANGLGACSEAQVGYLGFNQAKGYQEFTPAGANCPNDSKLGTVEIETPILKDPLPGAVYLASQDQNPFGSLLAIYITVDDPVTGVVVKLPAKVEADPKTGRLTATLSGAPQLPFEDFHLNFFKGAGASLRTPLGCGRFETTSELTPWSAPEGATAHPTDSFQIEGGAGGGACVTDEAHAPDQPSFEAGTLDPTANAYTPFALKLARADGTQQLSGIDTTLPPGLIARLAGTSYCPDAALAAAAAKSGAGERANPSCPASSRVGSVDVAAGAGPTPFHAAGTAYLAGPYKGAPLSLAVITPALAGPFDLGTVVVHTALQVDPETTRVRATSDPFPSILQGIPLDIRSIALNLDRPSFTKNPTSCDPFAITGAATTLAGQSASLSNPFQVGDCRKLAFKPKLALRLKGGTKRNDNQALTATLTYPQGGSYANIARAAVTLPHSEFLDQSHIRTICTRVQFAAGPGNGAECPPGSIYGHARALTPLLDGPLEGPVYLRASDNTLPDLVAALGGQIDVVLDGRIDTGKGGGIRNTFDLVPDAPVSKFTLRLFGGKRGLVVNSENLCRPRAKTHAVANFTAQNGKVYDTTPEIANDCRGKKRSLGHKR